MKMMMKTVALFTFAAGLLTGSVSSAMTPAVATVYTDENGFDTTPEGTPSSTTYVPGDYCIIDLATGNTTIWRNVTNPTIFNVDEYKTTKMVFRYVPQGKFKMKASYYTTESYQRDDCEIHGVAHSRDRRNLLTLSRRFFLM